MTTILLVILAIAVIVICSEFIAAVFGGILEFVVSVLAILWFVITEIIEAIVLLFKRNKKSIFK